MAETIDLEITKRLDAEIERLDGEKRKASEDLQMVDALLARAREARKALTSTNGSVRARPSRPKEGPGSSRYMSPGKAQERLAQLRGAFSIDQEFTTAEASTAWGNVSTSYATSVLTNLREIHAVRKVGFRKEEGARGLGMAVFVLTPWENDGEQ